MKKKLLSLLLLFPFLSGCSAGTAEAEIQIPIYDDSAGKAYKTAEAELRDFTTTLSAGGSVSYAFADTLTIPYDTNVVSYDIKRNDKFSEGEVIAVFDPSALDYDYQNQKILTDDAYSRYLSSGSETSRLEYEQEQKKLELIQYEIDEYSIKAPYDCIITDAERLEAGDTVSAGTAVCTVARPDDVYVTLDSDKDKFAVGMNVGLKFGTNETYSAKVVMVPEKGAGRGLNNMVLIAFDDGEYERAKNDVGNIVAAGWVTVLADIYKKFGALCIPTDAVMQYSGSTYCYLDNNGERARVPIETGESFSDYTIILSGLSEGDVVSY